MIEVQKQGYEEQDGAQREADRRVRARAGARKHPSTPCSPGVERKEFPIPSSTEVSSVHVITLESGRVQLLDRFRQAAGHPSGHWDPRATVAGRVRECAGR